MANIQQPEMRRSGHDPLVQDSAKEKAGQGRPPSEGNHGPVPPDQVSPYGRPTAAADQAPEDQTPADQTANDQTARDQTARDQTAREQTATEKVAGDEAPDER